MKSMIKGIIMIAIVVLIGLAFISYDAENQGEYTARAQTSLNDLLEWSRSKSPEFQERVQNLVSDIQKRMNDQEGSDSALQVEGSNGNAIAEETKNTTKAQNLEDLQYELGVKILESQLKNMNEEELIHRLEGIVQKLKKDQAPNQEETNKPIQ